MLFSVFLCLFDKNILKQQHAENFNSFLRPEKWVKKFKKLRTIVKDLVNLIYMCHFFFTLAPFFLKVNSVALISTCIKSNIRDLNWTCRNKRIIYVPVHHKYVLITLILVACTLRHGVAGGTGGCFSPLPPSNFLQNNKIFLSKYFNLLLSSSLYSFEQTRRKNLSKNIENIPGHVSFAKNEEIERHV